MSNSVMDIKGNMFVRVNSIFVVVLLSRFDNPLILKQIEPKYVYKFMKIGRHDVSISCILSISLHNPGLFSDCCRV